jgi:NADP-dependent 3-hydroxy acid dehydrogenase YdfG
MAQINDRSFNDVGKISEIDHDITAENQRIVWITGASSGNGPALCRYKGAMVAVSGRIKGLLDKLSREIHQKGGQAEALVCDVADTTRMEQAVSDISHQFGRLDMAIAHA